MIVGIILDKKITFVNGWYHYQIDTYNSTTIAGEIYWFCSNNCISQEPCWPIQKR